MTNKNKAPSRLQLSLIERLGHAYRTRSVQSALIGMVDILCGRLAPRWSTQIAPWYAGRAVESLRLDLRADDNVFDVANSASDSTFMKGLLWLGRYEALERYAVAKFLPKSLPVIELGASIGVLACLANRRLTDPDRQVSVEANPFLIPTLIRNRDRNRGRFRIVHGAIAYGVESADFRISDSSVASSLDATGATTTVKVRTVSLEDILKDAGFDRCTLICDIEGMEMALVETEAAVLRRCVKTLLMEVHPEVVGVDRIDALAAMLRRLGFSPVWQKGNVLVLANQGS